MEKRSVAVGFLSAVLLGGGLVGGVAWANTGSHPDVDTYEGGNVSDPVDVPDTDYAVEVPEAEAVAPAPEPEPVVVEPAPVVEAEPAPEPAPVEEAPAAPAPTPEPAPVLPPATVEVGPTGAGNADMAGNAASDD